MTSGHTITTEHSTARVQIVVCGATIADSTAAVLLHETGLPVRYYLPPDDIDMERLVPTETVSTCPFKGEAVYWSVNVDGTIAPDVAWSYPTPIPERIDIAGFICFFNERVDEIVVDGVGLERPETQWSTSAEV